MSTTHWIGVAVIALLSLAAVILLRRRVSARWHRFFRHPLAAFSLGWLVFILLLALFAPLIAPYRPSLQLDIVAMANQPPSWQHPFGTDLYARDIWSRILFGARVSLGTGVLAMLVAIMVGGTVGLVAGSWRAADALLMRTVDVGLAVPRIFLILIITALWGGLTLMPLILLLGLTGWFGTSRMVRAEVLALREAPFVVASRAMGASRWRIVVHHLLPNAAAPLIVSAALGIGGVMLLEAALSFLGVGVQPPAASWGNMIADGRDQLVTAPWTTLFPGMAIALAVMALNGVGDGLRDALNDR